MVSFVTSHTTSDTWRILDFGCGTGFEAEQLLTNVPHDRIASLVCYDPSPEMLERCRTRIAPIFPDAFFFDDLEVLRSSIQGAMFNLLTTNSLLHHLPDPTGDINSLLPLLTQDAYWIAGHEPSSRFYANPECLATYEAYLRERRWRRFFAPDLYITRLGIALGRRSNPSLQTAREAHRQGLFSQQPPPVIIQRLVDFHVAHSATEAASGRGLDFEKLERDFAGLWSRRWLETYAFMGMFHEEELPAKWSRLSHQLHHKYPLDGANFCTIWSRIAA